ncbi:hypothetical protein MBRA1_000224 [Malassezia brasiliensis]|uniref:Cation efflux protein transmembrane domain-containing protein n=1 Tax=Malassezia brasiliensis TaxID=1821822 RepID=A0AAF0IR69_9BASI|nr:hypothetical protein MBRA1_000224 [Malassezia brasiliensis]
MLKYPNPPHPKGVDDAHEKGHHGEQQDKDAPGPESTGSRNKQIIGFAKFYTREEAFEAREVLNGFRIDPERGCILKAELAKKNLHTKRSAQCVINKHQATNAHGVASRGVIHEPPLSMTDPHTAYAMAMLNAGIPSTQAKHFPPPLNMAAIADNSRDLISPVLPQSAPPRMDTVLSNFGAWTMPSNSFDMSTGERSSYVGSPNLARGATVLDAPRGPNKILSTGYDSLPKRPDVSVRQASFGEPRRLSAETRVPFRDVSVGEPLAGFDPTASLGRLQLGRDEPMSDRSEAKERGELSIPTPPTDSGDATLNSLAYAAGYKQGVDQGERFGHGEGRLLGREKGFELWEELGYYLGMIHTWRRILEQERGSGSRKTQKQLQHLGNLESLVQQMPMQNDSSVLHDEHAPTSNDDDDESEPGLQRLLERIRARYKLVSSSLAAVGIQPGRAGTQRTVAQVALLGLASNVLLCLLKAAAGWVLGSAVLLADASHSASDTFGDVLALCCLYKAQKRPTPRYPLGYGKLETLGSVGISIMLLCSSIGIIVHACMRLTQTMPDAWRASLGPATSWLGRALQILGAGHAHSHAHAHAHDTHSTSVSAISFVLIGILAKEALYQFTHRMARRTHSSVLEVGAHPLTQASAYHHRMEAIGSLGSFLAIAGSWLGFPMLDPLGGLLLALLYGRGAWLLLLSALQQLCDQRVSEDVYEAIQNAFDEAVVECKAHATPPCEYSALTAIGSGRNVVVHATLHFSPHVRVADALETEKRVHDAIIVLQIRLSLAEVA